MKNKGFTIDHVNKKVIVSKAFLTRASQLDTQEFEKVGELRRVLPGYDLVQKEIKKNPNKKANRNLTYGNMEKYIRAKEENPVAMLTEFQTVKVKSCIQSSPYAYVKKWFLEQYPDYTESKMEQEITTMSTVDEERNVA